MGAGVKLNPNMGAIIRQRAALGQFGANPTTRSAPGFGNMTIDGLAELEKALRDLPSELSGRRGGPLRKATRLATKEILLPAAKQKAPVDTGRLRNAIAMQIVKAKYRNAAIRGGSSLEGYVVGVKAGRDRGDLSGAYYGAFVERGTDRQTAQPFLRPALEENRQKLYNRFVEILDKDIKRLAAISAARSPKV